MIEHFTELEGVPKIEMHFKEADHIDDDEMEVFSNVLPTVSSFESISLNFEGCSNIADSGVNDIAEALKQVQNMKCFELIIGGELITDFSIEALAAAAAECPKLE